MGVHSRSHATVPDVSVEVENSRGPAMNVPVKYCENKGSRCIAKDREGNKWIYQAHSEAEAELTAEAVEERGYITTQWWRKQ